MKEEKTSIEEQFIEGSNYQCVIDSVDKTKPLVVRGIIKKDHIHACINDERDFYYVDTGYVGNFPSPGNPSGKKLWHRVVKNGLQDHEIRNVPSDRWENLVKQDPRLKWTGWKNYDKKILLVLPNPKATRYYNVDFDQWIDETKKEISNNIDLPIEIRVKGSRVARNNEYSIYDAFDSGVYATVTFNSIAALESVLYGIPAFVSVPCAASPLASTDLKKLSDPYKPSLDIITKQSHNIAYGQFTVEEIRNGSAWKILQRYSK